MVTVDRNVTDARSAPVVAGLVSVNGKIRSQGKSYWYIRVLMSLKMFYLCRLGCVDMYVCAYVNTMTSSTPEFFCLSRKYGNFRRRSAFLRTGLTGQGFALSVPARR